MSRLEELQDLIRKLEAEIEKQGTIIKNLKTQLEKKSQENAFLKHRIALLEGRGSIPSIKALSRVESLLVRLRKADIRFSPLPKRFWNIRGSRRKILLLAKVKGAVTITWLSLSLAEIWNVKISRRNLLKNLAYCVEKGQLLSAGILGKNEIEKILSSLPPFGPARIYVPGPFMPDFGEEETKDVSRKIGDHIRINLRTLSPDMYTKQLDHCVKYLISLCKNSEKWLSQTPIKGAEYLADLTRKLIHFFKGDLTPLQIEEINKALEKIATLLERKIRYYRLRGIIK